MIIKSTDKVQVNGKNKSVWVLDTDALTVTHHTTDAEPNVTTFSSDHIRYHLHYSAEYRPARLKKLVNDGTILSYLTDLDRSVAEAMFFELVKQMAARKGVTEQLKAQDQMLWIQRMNNIRNRAMEMANNDLIYV